jgi:hypothetical protein
MLAFFLWLAVSMAVGPGSAGALPESCPMEKAQYRSMDSQDITAELRTIGDHPGWPSDLALEIHTPAHETYWFLFDRGAARYINLISTTDVTQSGWAPPSHDGGKRPLGDMHYVAADSRLRIDQMVPDAGDEAPFYILLPDFPEILAHRASPAESVSLSFLRFAACE